MIDNSIHNPNKHNYRLHGTSDLNYARGNLLLGAGVMMGTMPGDSLDRVWFNDNTFYHYTPGIFNMSSGITMVHAHDNVGYSDVWSTFPQRVSTWDFSNNVMHPYTTPPTP